MSGRKPKRKETPLTLAIAAALLLAWWLWEGRMLLFVITQGGLSLKHTPMQEAIVRGDIKEVRARLRAGEDVNQEDNRGWTPLHTALEQGRFEIAELLHKHGANVDDKDINNETILANLRGRNKRAVQWLEAHGAR